MDIRDLWGSSARHLLIVALTGGIGSGKTEVAGELTRMGVEVIDADRVARDVVAAGTRTHQALIAEFGERILDTSGEINREALSSIVFKDKSRMETLNSITHPAIFQELVSRVNRYAREMGSKNSPVIVVDAALIVDVGVEGLFDTVVLVSADPELRLQRLVRLRGMNFREAESRLSSQLSEEIRRKKAHIIIENNGTLEDLMNRVHQVWRLIEEEARTRYPSDSSES